MTTPHRRPETTLERACPAYRAALAEYERAMQRQNETAVDGAWKRLSDIAEVFWQGADFAAGHGRARS